MSGVTVNDHGANDLLKRARELAKGKRVAVGILDRRLCETGQPSH